MAASSQKSPDGAKEPVSEDAKPVASTASVEVSTVPDSPPAAMLKEPPLDAKPAAAGTTVSTPTYESSEASEFYVTAKALLNQDDFEQALSTIEQGIVHTVEVLEAANCTDNLGVHPSMAPFHYLYGTTLLYSIEESSSPEQDAMMMAQQQAEDGAEEIQIAFENLDLARVILDKYLSTIDPSDEAKIHKLELDMAQVLLRLGDLQRTNGQNEAALADYQKCVLLRQKWLGPYDRKIADAHYNLALTYSLLVVQGDTPTSPEDGSAPPAPQITPEQRDLYRSQQFSHYLSCAEIFAAQSALLSGMDNVDEFLETAKSDIPSLKSTGDEGDRAAAEIHTTALRLKGLKKHVESLPQPTQEDAIHTFATTCDLLTEILETVEEARNAEQGVQQVTELKSQITAAVAAQGDVTNTSADATGNTDAAPAFGSAAAAAVSATAVQPTTMVVRKKKRKQPPPSEEQDSKPPAQKKPPPSSE